MVGLYSLSNTEASVIFLVQYRSICAAEWLDYSLSNTEASVQPSGWIIHCPIQKHLCSRVVGLFIVQYRSIWVAKCLVLWTSGQAMRKFSRRKTDGTFLTFPRKYDLTFHANCIQEK